MKIPEKLVRQFIEKIDLDYLQYNPNSNDKDDYLSHCDNYATTCFNISWSLGGTAGSCWNEDIHEVSGHSEPSLDELNEFLQKHYSHLDDSSLSEIFSKIEYNETTERDYYGGSTTEAKKSLPFNILAQSLMKVVPEYHDCELIDFEEFLDEHSNYVIQVSLENYFKIELNKKLNDDLFISPETKRLKL